MLTYDIDMPTYLKGKKQTWFKFPVWGSVYNILPDLGFL